MAVPELGELDGIRADATGGRGDQDVRAIAHAVELSCEVGKKLQRATVMLSDAATYSARTPPLSLQITSHQLFRSYVG